MTEGAEATTARPSPLAPLILAEVNVRRAFTRALLVGAGLAFLRVVTARSPDLKPLAFLWGFGEGLVAAPLALLELRAARGGPALGRDVAHGLLGWGLAAGWSLLAALGASAAALVIQLGEWPDASLVADAGVPGLSSGAAATAAVFLGGPAVGFGVVSALRGRAAHPVDQALAALVAAAAIGIGAAWAGGLIFPESRMLPGVAILAAALLPAAAEVVELMERLRADAL